MKLNPDDLSVESFQLDTIIITDDIVFGPEPVYRCTANPAHHSACHVCWNTDRTACARTCDLTCVVCSDYVSA